MSTMSWHENLSTMSWHSSVKGFILMNSGPVDKATWVRADQIIVLTGINTAEHYLDKLLRVRFFDVEKYLKPVFLTNDFSLPRRASPCSTSSDGRELFFWWIKQHLRINISVYVLVTIFKKWLHFQSNPFTKDL